MGTFIELWNLGSPAGVAVGPAGNVYVVERSDHRVSKYTADGSLITRWGGTQGPDDDQFSAPCGTAVDSNGNVYVADTSNHRTQKFDSGGVFLLS